ncbi:hypothetical protein, partial [Enterobacter hormaechei]|uniref:hypothetical protein n=1 Tax=Enterobacter hormaechei TaxID=158836 RepID=UPI001EF765F5
LVFADLEEIKDNLKAGIAPGCEKIRIFNVLEGPHTLGPVLDHISDFCPPLPPKRRSRADRFDQW